MAKKASQKTSHNPKRLLWVLLLLIISSAIGYGVYYWLDQNSNAQARGAAQDIAQQAATIADNHFADLAEKSNRFIDNPDLKIEHAYPVVLPAAGIPSELNFSEQDLVSRGRISPSSTLPELTLSALPDAKDTDKTVNTQALSIVRQLDSGDLLLIRWSLAPLETKLTTLVPDDIQIQLLQNDKSNQVTVLSIHDKKRASLKPIPLAHQTWSINTSYNTPTTLISPLNAALATVISLLLLGLAALALISRRHTARDSNIPSHEVNNLPNTSNSLGAHDVSEMAQGVQAPSAIDTQDLPLEPISEVMTTLPDAIAADPLLHPSPEKTTGSSTTPEKSDDSLTDTPEPADTPKNINQEAVQHASDSQETDNLIESQNTNHQIELAEEMVFDRDISSEENQHTDARPLDEDDNLLDSLEDEIKSTSPQGSASSIDFKAPSVPDVGELKIAEADTDALTDTTDELQHDNLIDFTSTESLPEAAETNMPVQADIATLFSQVDTDVLSDAFRAFDIRTQSSVLSIPAITIIAKSLASFFVSKGQHHIVVGRDVRSTSPEISKTLIETLVNNGLRIIDIGVVTTPMMVYAAKNTFGCGIIVTASHNSAEYNGLKWIVNNSSPSTEQVQEVKQIMLNQSFVEPLGQGSVKQQSFEEDYASAINQDVLLADLPTVVIDALHGTTSIVAKRIMEDAGCTVVMMHDNIDGDFTSGNPNPTEPNRLEQLSNAVVKHGAYLGMAFDCDGDRLAIVDEMGKVISSEQLLCLFATILLETNPAADIIYDIKCSRNVANHITSCGGRPIIRPTGAHLIRETLNESDQAVFAGELSGHFMFNDNRLGQYDDGIYAALRLLEWTTQTGRPLSSHLKSIPKVISTDDIYIPVAHKSDAINTIQQIIEYWHTSQDNNTTSPRINAVINTLDGFRLDFPKGFSILRASNTTNAITVRIAADDEHTLKNIQQQLTSFVRATDQTLANRLAELIIRL